MPVAIASDEDVFEHARLVLKRLMKETRTTQEDLAGALGTTQASISDRVRGRIRLNLVDVHRFARHFGVAPSEFFPPTSVSESACIRLALVA